MVTQIFSQKLQTYLDIIKPDIAELASVDVVNFCHNHKLQFIGSKTGPVRIHWEATISGNGVTFVGTPWKEDLHWVYSAYPAEIMDKLQQAFGLIVKSVSPKKIVAFSAGDATLLMFESEAPKPVRPRIYTFPFSTWGYTLLQEVAGILRMRPESVAAQSLTAVVDIIREGKVEEVTVEQLVEMLHERPQVAVYVPAGWSNDILESHREMSIHSPEVSK